MLTEFFNKCAEDPNASELLYHEFPKHYTWDTKARTWKPRQRGGDKDIGRMVSVSVKDSERYFLRLLLCYVRGPRSYESLRTVNQVLHPTFQAAAAARNLLANDNEWQRCMQEACLFNMPHQLRQLFSTILTCCSPADPRKLWDEFLHHMSEDFQRLLETDATDRRVIFKMVRSLDKYLIASASTIMEFPSLPQHTDFEDLWMEANDGQNPLIAMETNYDRTTLTEVASRREQLNDDQKRIYDTIMEAVNNPQAHNRVSFVDGPGGTGKSFTLNTILANIRSENKIAIAVATSGIAALQLMGGRTGHSTFKLGLSLTAESTCFISAQSDRAKMLEKASIIIWDEAPLMTKFGFEALDRTLKDIMGNDLIFGGKIVVLAGDFRQMLPVIPGATPAEIIEQCVQRSYIWGHCTPLQLKVNMRTLTGQNVENAAAIMEFNTFLRRVGEHEGSECEQCCRGHVKIPKDMTIPWNDNDEALDNLIAQVFPDNTNDFKQHDYFCNKDMP